MHHGRKSCPFATRTVLPATRTSVTLATSFFAERKDRSAPDLYALANVHARARRHGAASHQVADGAARRRTRGRIFTAIKLHPRPPLRGVLVLVEGAGQDIEPPRSALAQPRRGRILIHFEPRQRCDRLRHDNRKRRSRGNHLRRQRRVQVFAGRAPEAEPLSPRPVPRQTPALSASSRRRSRAESVAPGLKRTGTGPTLSASVTVSPARVFRRDAF